MKFVLPSLWMTKIFNDFYGSAVFKATKFFLMTKLEFGKQLVMDRTLSRCIKTFERILNFSANFNFCDKLSQYMILNLYSLKRINCFTISFVFLIQNYRICLLLLPKISLLTASQFMRHLVGLFT